MSIFQRKKQDKAMERSDYEKLDQCLTHCDFTKKITVDIPPTSPLYQVVEIINGVIMERQEAATVALSEIDNTVQALTSMTSIRTMLMRISEQTSQLGSLTAQSEELGSSANEVASSATNSSAFVEQAAMAAATGGEKIHQAIRFVENSYEEFEKVSRQVQEVLNSMKEIEQIIGVIAGVADQTNLLALNAAIEAARAAEHGRGFAVVADEVRKLAEHTKTSVTDIRSKIDNLSQSSLDTAKNITSLTQTMQNGKTVMQDAAESLKGIIENFTEITNDINNIAASSEEQSASVEESAGRVEGVAQAAEQIENIANITGQGIYEISQALQKIRLDQIHRVSELSTHQALELYKTDHLLWTWRIYNMLLGFEKLKSSEVGNYHDCRLGRWVDSQDADKCRSLATFSLLELPHKQVHELAYAAAVAYEKKDREEAERILEQMSKVSQEVVGVLSQLQLECKN